MRHRAKIISVHGNTLTARIIDGGSCETCRLAGCCSSTPGTPAADIRLHSHAPQDYEPGDTVTVELAPRAMGRAMVWSFVVPLILLAAGILSFGSAKDPTLGATVGIVAVAVYFLVLRIVRGRISRHVRWRLVEPF